MSWWARLFNAEARRAYHMRVMGDFRKLDDMCEASEKSAHMLTGKDYWYASKSSLRYGARFQLRRYWKGSGTSYINCGTFRITDKGIRDALAVISPWL